MATRPETTDTAELTETEQRNLRAVTEVLHYWNTRDIPGVLSFYDDTITWHNVGLGETYRGKIEVGAFLERFFTAFPDLNFQVTHKIARGNNVAEQWLIRATHLGPFLGVPPTGRAVEIPGMSMVEMRNGKFLRDDFYYDTGRVMRQLGLLPPLPVFESPVGRAVLWAAVNRMKIAAGLAAAGAGLVLLASQRARRRR